MGAFLLVLAIVFAFCTTPYVLAIAITRIVHWIYPLR